MKKRLLYFALLLGGACGLSSCFDDKSVEPFRFVPDILIDTTGIPGQHDVFQYDRLQINPAVSLEGGAPGDLSYKWMLNAIPTVAIGTGVNQANYFCIGEKMALDTVIALHANQTTYYLWYQVTDNSTGMRKDVLWKVLVRPAYNEGLLIGSTRDGSTTDLSLVEGSLFTVGWNKEDKISHELYSASNGTTYDGIAKHIVFSQNTDVNVNSKQFYVVGDDCYELLDGLDYTRLGRNFEVIHDHRLTLNTTQMFVTCWNFVCWVNDGKLYYWQMNMQRPYPNINITNQYSLQVGESMVTKIGRVDKHVAYTHNYAMDAWGVWYDDLNGVFLYQQYNPTTEWSPVLPVPAASAFDSRNATGLKTLFAATGMNKDFYFIMRNLNTSSNEVYIFGENPTRPKALHAIPGNEMDDAIAYIVAENANTFYFATRTRVYSVTLGSGSPIVTARYTVPEGEITCMTMFRHSWFLRSQPGRVPLDTHENTLLVGVAGGNTGKLLAIPILNPASADIDVANIKTYTGFGRITAIAPQE
ncbi:MAG: hypothetical protein LBK12_02765 [Odoribacteraceae bacterium]|jgi:hypothetical protein|nr:hypothetical protein [Odoribacteraceae bacterium]